MEHSVFMNDKGLATFKCPKCLISRTKDIGNFDKIAVVNRIKCSCSCGNSFTVKLEKRKFYRKDIELVGRYISLTQESNEMRGSIKIIDISQSGLMFKTNIKHDLKIGDKLMVEFILEKKQEKFISKKGVIRRIIDKKVGIQFDTTEHYDQFGKLLIR